MNAWKPTDEQARGLGEAVSDLQDQPTWSDGSFTTDGLEIAASPAFQSIIRAAQAEALREWADVQEQMLSGHASEDADFDDALPWINAVRVYANLIEARS